MNITFIKIGVILTVCLIASGCATRKEIVRFKQDTAVLIMQVESLRAENKQLRKMVQELNNSVNRLHTDNSRARAELLTEIESIKSQSIVIDSKLDDTTLRMSRFLHSPEKTNVVQIVDDSTNTFNETDTAAKPESGNPGFSQGNIYNLAYIDLSKGNYQLAITGFSDFQKHFPQSELADNAQYCIGEAYYAQRDYQAAIAEFNKVLKNYPQSDKIAATLLKIGFSYLNLNNYTESKKYLKMVIEKYPHSEEARIAGTRLNSFHQ